MTDIERFQWFILMPGRDFIIHLNLYFTEIFGFMTVWLDSVWDCLKIHVDLFENYQISKFQPIPIQNIKNYQNRPNELGEPSISKVCIFFEKKYTLREGSEEIL